MKRKAILLATTFILVQTPAMADQMNCPYGVEANINIATQEVTYTCDVYRGPVVVPNYTQETNNNQNIGNSNTALPVTDTPTVIVATNVNNLSDTRTASITQSKIDWENVDWETVDWETFNWKEFLVWLTEYIDNLLAVKP